MDLFRSSCLGAIPIFVVWTSTAQSNSKHQSRISSRDSIQQKPQGKSQQGSSKSQLKQPEFFGTFLSTKRRPAKTRDKHSIASHSHARASFHCLQGSSCTLSRRHAPSQASASVKHPLLCLFQQTVLSRQLPGKHRMTQLSFQRNQKLLLQKVSFVIVHNKLL